MFYLDLFRALDRENVRYVLIGGLALNIHGVERATMDVDLMLAMDAENLDAFRRAAESLGMTSVLPVSMKDFAHPATLQRWISEKNRLAFALRSQELSAPTVDILVQPKVAFELAWARHVEKDLGDIHVRLAHIDDLIGVYAVLCGTCLQPPSIATDAGQPQAATSRALMALSRAGEARRSEPFTASETLISSRAWVWLRLLAASSRARPAARTSPPSGRG